MMYFKDGRWFLYGLVARDQNCGEWKRPILGDSIARKIKSIFEKAPTMCIIRKDKQLANP